MTKRNPILRSWLDDSIIADSFAGGGGASSGIESVLGRSPDIAINHDEEAIAMHRANHPSTQHYIENVWEIDPKLASRGRPVGLLWCSPTCTHFSKAKGTALDEESVKIRALAWVAVRWAAAVKPRLILLENVEEFEKWGPLHRAHSEDCPGVTCIEGCTFGKAPRNRRTDKKGRARRIATHAPGCLGVACVKGCQIHKPIRSRIGETFKAFVRKLRHYYVHVEWRQLRACDFGAPTTRKRLFLQASDAPIRWPAPTHGPGREQPYRTAAECIDWTIPCPSIFERDKPLKDKTLARIARGIRKFVLENPRPFIVPSPYGAYGDKSGRDVRVNDSLATMPTICGAPGGHTIVAPTIVKVKTYGGGGNDAKSVNAPIGTITASKRGEHAVAQTVLVPYLIHRSNGERPDQEPRIYDVHRPLGTVVAGGIKHATCVALLVKHNGGNNDAHGSSGQHIDRPMDTLTSQDTKALTVAHLVRYNNENSEDSVRVQGLGAPISTIDTANRIDLVASHLVKLRGTSAAHLESCSSGIDEPVPTISASGTHVAQVAAFLVRYNGCSTGQEADAPIGTLDTTDRYGLVTVTIDGAEYVVVDIGMRMLTPRELYRAQGFSDNYEIAPLHNGKPLSKTAQIRMVGNSVCPPIAAAIVGAQLKFEKGEPALVQTPPHPAARFGLYRGDNEDSVT